MRGVRIMRKRKCKKIGYNMIAAGILAAWGVCGVYESSDPETSLWPYIIALLICMMVALIGDQIRKKEEKKDD